MSTLPDSKRALFLNLGGAILLASSVNDASTEEILTAAEEWRRSYEKKLRRLASSAKKALSVKRIHPAINSAAAMFFSPIVQGEFNDVLQSAEGYLQKLSDKVRADIESGAEGCQENFRIMLTIFSSLDRPL